MEVSRAWVCAPKRKQSNDEGKEYKTTQSNDDTLPKILYHRLTDSSAT